MIKYGLKNFGGSLEESPIPFLFPSNNKQSQWQSLLNFYM